jgi:hypothetical protein
MSPPDAEGVDGAVVVVVGGAVVVVVGAAGGVVVGVVVTGAPPTGGALVAGAPAEGVVVDVVGAVVGVVVVGTLTPLADPALPLDGVVVIVGWPTMGRTPLLPNSVSSSCTATERQSKSTVCAASALALA